MVTDIKGIVNEVNANGGGTWKIASIQVNPHCRVMATLNPHRTGFYVASPQLSVEVSELTPESIAAFIESALPELQNGRLLGIWCSNFTYYIELADHVPGRIEAIEKGYNRNQLAIWDIANSQEIRLQPREAIAKTA